MSELTPNLGLFKYNPLTDGKEVFSINTALNNNWDILDNLGSGKNIGEIVASTIPLTDAGLHLLDGALIQGNGIYSAFVDYIAELYRIDPYAAFFAQPTEGRTAEQNWQSSVSTYGVCGKFVYNSVNNTVRLPKITGILEGTTDVNALGDLVQAGLPNITGVLNTNQNMLDPYGAFKWSASRGPVYTHSADSYSGLVNIIFDASRSNSIYGDSTTVQPQTIKAFYYIVIATSTKTNIQVDIDEIATDLNEKVDKADLAEVQCVVETYINGTSWYRIWSDGWIEQGGNISNSTITFLKPFSNTNYTVTTNNTNNSTSGNTTTYNDLSIYSNASYNKTTTSVFIRGSGTWYACGYII